MIALAGGPGQAALPFAADAAQIMAAGARDARPRRLRPARHRRLRRRSRAPRSAMVTAPVSSASIPDCAKEVGATRGLYTTDDSVYDIEQIRKALGYTKLVLYGTSYGTKVAERYAALYPQNVAGARARLDGGAQRARRLRPVELPGGAAHPRAALRRRRLPRDRRPRSADLATVLARLAHATRSRPASTTARASGSGSRSARRRSRRCCSPATTTRCCAPTSRRRSQPRPPATTGCSRSSSTTPTSAARLELRQVDNPLFFDTECEELPFPWNRADAPAARLQRGARGGPGAARRDLRPVQRPTAVARQRRRRPAPTGRSRRAAPETTITVAAQRADADHQRRRRPAHADRQRRRRRGDDPRRHGGRRAPDRPLGADDRAQLVRAVAPSTRSSPARRSRRRARRGRCPPTCSPRAAQPASLATALAAGGTHGRRRAAPPHAVELTLEWSAREFAESLFETLIGSYNPSYNHGLGGLYGGFAKDDDRDTSSQKVTLALPPLLLRRRRRAHRDDRQRRRHAARSAGPTPRPGTLVATQRRTTSRARSAASTCTSRSPRARARSALPASPRR